jgi:hypothetical protein
MAGGCGCDVASNPCYCGTYQDPNCDPSWCAPGADPTQPTAPSWCADGTACGDAACRDCSNAPSYADLCAQGLVQCATQTPVGGLVLLLVLAGAALLLLPSFAQGLGAGLGSRV